MKNHLILFFVFVILSQSKIFSQGFKVGPVELVSYGFDGVYPLEDKSFFVAHYDRMFGTTLKLTHHTNFEKDNTFNIAPNDCGVMVIGGKVFVFEKNKTKGLWSMSTQEYDNNCMPVGNSKELISYERNSSGEIVNENIIQSLNKNFFAVYYEIKTEDQIKFVFKIYDKSFKLLTEGTVKSNFDKIHHRFFHKLLSDSGDLYFTVNPIEVGGLYVWKLENNELNEIKISVDEKKVYDLLVVPNADGSVGCFGIRGGALEVFEGILDFTNHSMTVTNSYELTKEFIAFEGLQYKITDAIKCQDGGTVLVFEQYYDCEESMILHPFTSVTCLAYYDVKVLKIDGNGGIVWKERLGHTNQIKYYGRYNKSFLIHSNEDKSVIYMNLNTERDPLIAPVPFTVSDDNEAKQDNYLGKITIDLKDGKIEREMLSSVVSKGWFFEYEYGVWDEYNEAFLIPFTSGFLNYRYGLFPF